MNLTTVDPALLERRFRKIDFAQELDVGGWRHGTGLCPSVALVNHEPQCWMFEVETRHPQALLTGSSSYPFWSGWQEILE